MKPEDLKAPFPRDQRQVLIKDRIWYVPHYNVPHEQFVFPGWNASDLFGNANPVCLEYCSGNGAWIAAKASGNPHKNWVAIERKFMRVKKIWSKIKNHDLGNLVALCGEGHNATARYFPAACIQEVYINFPDPWPKKRHAKHRIIQPEFVHELARIMLPQGTLTFVTDDADYSQWTINILSQSPNFIPHYPSPHYITEWPDYGNSFFDSLWREKGRSIRYHQYVKRAAIA